ncbi:MAG: AAA family ATPase [Alphaproteobacteria bacterium]|nr:AAA family ATPase [Alphaproteobacteria bacterium]
MLKELKISNFRGFGNEIKVRFAPITILIGRNNAGKSSIIKFLLMLQQSLETGSAGFLAARGSRVNLGKFSDLRNVNSRGKYLHFSLEMEERGSASDAVRLYLDRTGKSFTGKIGYKAEANVLYKSASGSFQGKDQKIALLAEGEETLARSMKIAPDSAFLSFFDGQQKELAEKKSDAEAIIAEKAEEACIDALAYQIRSLRHILPVRERSLPHAFDVGVPAPEDVGQDGQHALQHLRTADDLPENRGPFIRRHLEKVSGIADIKFSKPMGDLTQCSAINQMTGAEVNIADFGFGVSQCIPIVVQGAIMSPYTTLMVEQPEVQVHPSAQLEMGEFFANLWNEKKVGSVIETHSNNILLRLQLLIASEILCATDVSVVFFDIKDKMPIIENLSIEKNGSLRPGLPMEFFHQDIWEAMKLEGG